MGNSYQPLTVERCAENKPEFSERSREPILILLSGNGPLADPDLKLSISFLGCLLEPMKLILFDFSPNQHLYKSRPFQSPHNIKKLSRGCRKALVVLIFIICIDFPLILTACIHKRVFEPSGLQWTDVSLSWGTLGPIFSLFR